MPSKNWEKDSLWGPLDCLVIPANSKGCQRINWSLSINAVLVNLILSGVLCGPGSGGRSVIYRVLLIIEASVLLLVAISVRIRCELLPAVGATFSIIVIPITAAMRLLNTSVSVLGCSHLLYGMLSVPVIFCLSEYSENRNLMTYISRITLTCCIVITVSIISLEWSSTLSADDFSEPIASRNELLVTAVMFTVCILLSLLLLWMHKLNMSLFNKSYEVPYVIRKQADILSVTAPENDKGQIQEKSSLSSLSSFGVNSRPMRELSCLSNKSNGSRKINSVAETYLKPNCSSDTFDELELPALEVSPPQVISDTTNLPSRGSISNQKKEVVTIIDTEKQNNLSKPTTDNNPPSYLRLSIDPFDRRESMSSCGHRNSFQQLMCDDSAGEIEIPVELPPVVPPVNQNNALICPSKQHLDITDYIASVGGGNGGSFSGSCHPSENQFDEYWAFETQDSLLADEREMRAIWEKVCEATGAEGLYCEEISEYLDTVGVDIREEDSDVFFDICLESSTDGTVSWNFFISAFQEFKNSDMLTTEFSRIHLAAIALVFSECDMNVKASKVWQEVAPNMTGIDDNTLTIVLQSLQLPHESGEIGELKEEFNCQTMEETDFISLFYCDHSVLNEHGQISKEIQTVRRAVAHKNNITYKTEDQASLEETQQRMASFEKILPITCVYATVVFCSSTYDFSFSVDPQLWKMIMYLIGDIYFFAWVCRKITFERPSRKQLVIDITTAFPLDIIGIIVKGSVLRDPIYGINKFFLVTYLSKFITVIGTGISPRYSRIFHAMYSLCLFAHGMACFFKLTATQVSDQDVQMALTVANFSTLPAISQYLQAYDYAIKTMSGLTRGQPVPPADLQVLYAGVSTILGVITYATLLSTIGNALQVPDAKMVFKEKINDVKAFLEYKKLPSWYRTDCLQYYKHVFETGSYNDSKLVHDLHPELDALVQIEVCKAVISRVCLFTLDFVISWQRFLNNQTKIGSNLLNGTRE